MKFLSSQITTKIKSTYSKHNIIMLVVLSFFFTVYAQVQINPSFSMPDVNITQFGDKAYAFCGTDIDPYTINNNDFQMPYWRCYSSTDLINWTLESVLYPEDTYIGKTDKCFAGHGIKKGDNWYWYFSNYVNNVGVVVAKSPQGPWIDPLKKPLLPSDISITKGV